MEFAWRAFAQLSCQRQVGFGTVPLAVCDIVAWMEIHGVFDVSERMNLFQIITSLDNVWMKWAEEKSGSTKPIN